MLQPNSDPRAPQRRKKRVQHAHPAEGPRPTKAAGHQKKNLAGGLVGSAIAVAIIAFALGKLPQLNSAGADVNTRVQAHNDELVHMVLHSGPAVLTGFGSLLLIGLVWAGKPVD